MAVAKSAVSAVLLELASNAQHTDATGPITVGAGDTFLLFMQEVDSATPGTVSAVWDVGGSAQSMTQIGTTLTNSAGATAMSVAFFGLVSPTAGAKTFGWTWSGVGAAAIDSYLALISFTGTLTTSVAAATKGFNSGNIANGASTTGSVSTSASISNTEMAVAWCSYLISGGFTIDGTNIGNNQTGATNAASSYYTGANATLTSNFSGLTANDNLAAMIVGLTGTAGGDTLGGAMQAYCMSRRKDEKKIWVPGRRIVKPTRKLLRAA